MYHLRVFALNHEERILAQSCIFLELINIRLSRNLYSAFLMDLQTLVFPVVPQKFLGIVHLECSNFSATHFKYFKYIFLICSICKLCLCNKGLTLNLGYPLNTRQFFCLYSELAFDMYTFYS